jgi:hypothetical protein
LNFQPWEFNVPLFPCVASFLFEKTFSLLETEFEKL